LNFKLVKTKSAQLPYQVVRSDGMPDLPLTSFAVELYQSLSDSSVSVYLRTILHFANWLESDQVAVRYKWHLLDDPSMVRSALRQYLHVEGNCKIVSRPDRLGLKSVYISSTDNKHINVRTFLSALKKFYETAIESNFYSHHNPLVHVEAAQIHHKIKKAWREETLALEGRERMPSVSGIDAPTGQFRLSENYFKYNGEQWQPQAIESVRFPTDVFNAGLKYGWSLREQCICKMLFESGARISEILSLTARDWAESDFGHKLRTQNKGSYRKRIKTIIISQSTVKLLRRYFDSPERQKHTSESVLFRQLGTLKRRDITKLDQLPLFINQRGNQMTPALFRDYYWRPALHQAGIDADPHTCRHWFVTNAIKTIETVSKGKGEQERRKEELMHYMAWRSGEKTLKIYEHVCRADSFQKTIVDIHNEMHRQETDYAKRAATKKGNTNKTEKLETPSFSSSSLSTDLAFILGEDDV
jgi:site-specific recombinase XerD